MGNHERFIVSETFKNLGKIPLSWLLWAFWRCGALSVLQEGCWSLTGSFLQGLWLPSQVAGCRAHNEADSNWRHASSSLMHGFFGIEPITVFFYSISINWLWDDASLVLEKSPQVRDWYRAEKGMSPRSMWHKLDAVTIRALVYWKPTLHSVWKDSKWVNVPPLKKLST